MKYKNSTDKILKFRANNKDGIKQVFVVKPDEEIETDRPIVFPGMVEVREEITKKKKKEVD